MSLMQISQKKIKRRFLGLILGLSCLIGLYGCSKKTVVEEVVEEVVIEETIVEDIEINEDLFNVKNITLNDTALYRVINDELIEVGNVNANVNLDMSDITHLNYLNIKDTDLYVNTKDLQVSERWYEKRNHLVPYNMNIKTNSSYTLYDVKGNPLMTINSEDEYPLYVIEDDKYGILFQNEIVYMDKDNVNSMYENLNSDIEMGNELAVLMYHFFYDESQGESRKDGNFVEVNELREQLQTLQDNGYSTLTMQEVLLFMENKANIPSRSVVITIDDGDPSVFKYAYPVIKEFNMNATLFLIAGHEDPILNYDYIMMREDGLELQSHGFLMHQGGCPQGHGGRLLCVDYETGVEDTRMSLDYVDGGFVYCYPFGDVNENAKKIVGDAGVKMAFTTVFGKIKPGMDLLELPRIRVTGGNGIKAFMNNIN